MGIIECKIIPNAAKSRVVGYVGEALKIQIAAPPEKGKANEELIYFLSKLFKVPKSAIQILTGETGRLKRVSIEGLSTEEIQDKVSRALCDKRHTDH
ncbi:MAG TPA: DUF167 domain-containing protein [Chlamydiales bacterium]|nr:DUF167 domain-containing protein [Chlamydiales bacterium]